MIKPFVVRPLLALCLIGSSPLVTHLDGKEGAFTLDGGIAANMTLAFF
jgi:hypothetical protein